jgi:murein DD-endopeptidase MepM/ murein hydrolase activator NlpD
VYRIKYILAVLIVTGCFAGPVAKAQSSEPPSQDVIHVVKQGETVFSIAQSYGLTVDAVTHFNGISDPRQIYTGQQLVIPVVDSDATVQALAPYLVQAGDTLQAIALRYQTDIQELMRVNRMVSPAATYAGQVIQVPVSGEEEGETILEQSVQALGTISVVQPGDTVFRTALRYGMSSWTLAKASQVINSALLFPGQDLLVPGDALGLLPEPFAEIQIYPLPGRQGGTILVALKATAPVSVTARLFEQDTSLLFDGERENTYYAAIGVGALKEPGLYDLDFVAVDDEGRSTGITAGVVVKDGNFGFERIDLSSNLTGLLDPAVIATERERLNEVIYLVTPERFWDGAFLRPSAGTISSYFGSRRSYNGGPYTSYHSGVDYRAPTGTPVVAAASGTVVLAEALPRYGNMIVIDHGWGVMTGYGHLSSMDVTVGQRVSAGDLLGKVGSTGQSTGSHLHWEVWVGGTSVDGTQWLEMSPLGSVLE